MERGRIYFSKATSILRIKWVIPTHQGKYLNKAKIKILLDLYFEFLTLA